TPFDSYHYFESVSLEAIYRLLSPYKDPIGLALYFEPSIGDQERELEWKVILQKNWLEDRLVWALNINYELEFEKADGGGYERDEIRIRLHRLTHFRVNRAFRVCRSVSHCRSSAARDFSPQIVHRRAC